MSNDHAGAVERLRQDILDPQGVWRHCRVAMVNKYDTEEVVGFPSFTVDDLRTVLSALSASEARLRVAVEGLEAAKRADDPAAAYEAVCDALRVLATIEDKPHDH